MITEAATVVVGMSGGVDSAAAAAILRDAGCHVVGLTMLLGNPKWAEDGTRGEPEGSSDVERARLTCTELGIQHEVVDLRDAFASSVVEPFVREYLEGRTPNPCTVCNAAVRFPHLVSYAREIGASHVATGHYVRVRWSPASGRHQLLRARASSKDQSYMLYGLTQDLLSCCLFPLGELDSKDVTRAIARVHGLSVAEREESQDICFVAGRKYSDLIASLRPDAMRPGPIVDEAGREIGRHAGVALYTIGQRRGVPATGLGARYVTRIDATNAVVHVGPAEDLLARGFVAGKLNWVSIEEPADNLAVSVRIRYNAAVAQATLLREKDGVRCVFCDPQRAVTPGQAAVFYDGDVVLEEA